jgi:hypothetical protein
MGGGATAPLTSYHGNTGTLFTVYDPNANAGVVEIAGNNNTNGYNAGSLAFINNNNSDGSTPWSAGSKYVALIRAQLYTSDSNAGDDSGADLVFYRKNEAAAGTEGMRIKHNGDVSLANGNLIVAGGKGIDFSASESGGVSTNGSILDDYEEGTWTGAVMDSNSGGSQNISINNVACTYTKIGRQVTCWFYFKRNETGSRTGAIQWNNSLPFTSANDISVMATGTWWLDEGGPSSGDSVGGAIYIKPNSTQGQFVHPTQDSQQAGTRYLEYSQWSQHRPIYGSFTYYV